MIVAGAADGIRKAGRHVKAIDLTAAALRADLPSSYEVAPRPDHPFLLDGPDLLVGGNGILTAFFEPKREEMVRPDVLLVRLALTRLALPQHCRCVLIVAGHQGDDLADLVGRDFHVVEHPRRVRQISALTQDGEYVGMAHPLPSALYRFGRERCAYMMRLSHDFFGDKRGVHRAVPAEALLAEIGGEPASGRSWTGRSHTLRRWRSHDLQELPWGKTLASQVDLEYPPALRSRIRRLCFQTMRLSFTMDTGVPYYTNPSLAVVFANHLPYAGYDPGKLVRAGALAGLVFVPSVSLPGAKKMVGTAARSLHALERRLYERDQPQD